MEQAEKTLDDVIKSARRVDVLDERVNNLSRVLRDLSEEVAALRRAILTAALSFAVSAILIAATVYLVFK